MKKIKKIIPFFVILISSIFFKIGNVFADDSIQVINYPASVVSELLRHGSTKSLDFIYNNTSTYKYTNMALNFINNGTYKNYGKYYFYDHWGSDVPLVYVTDYPEVLTIIAYDEDDSKGKTGHFTYHINYDSSKPIYKYKPNSSSSVRKITTSEIQDGGHDWGFADEKLEDPYFIRSNFPEVRIIGGRTLQLDDVSYTNNEAVFIGSEDGSISLNKYLFKYKTGFISSEAYDVLGKVSVEFSENDSSIYKTNNAQFKLQFGSNDFTKENIPVFSHMKIYGKYTDNNTNTWEEVDVNSISAANEKMGIQIIDTTYDYVEGALADSTITFQMDFMENVNSLYENWKIEFYFDNTENSYIYCFDSLKNSKWKDTPKFLENYIFYEFPSNYMYAYISSDSEENSGRVYFPTNSIENSEVLLNGKYYNISSKEFDAFLNSYIYESDSYYSYIDFKCNTSEKIFTLNRYKGSVEHYRNLYGPDFLSFIKILFNAGNLQQAYLVYSESTYFYAPVGYNVVFSNGNDDISVNTGNGFIDISVGDTTDMTNSSSYATNENILVSFINKTWNNFISPFKVFSQLKGIIDNIHFDSNNNEVPHFKVDFSFFGVVEKLDIIDFTWYLQYRDTVFNFIYLSIGGITIFKVISALRRVFGGGD